MTRETLATMFLCVPIWSALAAGALTWKDHGVRIVGAVLVAFAVAGFMAFLVAVISMAARP